MTWERTAVALKMGVKGLWTILSPAGQQVDLSSLEGKKVAIDTSIWLYQFGKLYTDSLPGNAHILGFSKRIAKLLSLKIKPVFVFDGPAPQLKADILSKRRLCQQDPLRHRKQAQRILKAQIKKEIVKKTGKQHEEKIEEVLDEAFSSEDSSEEQEDSLEEESFSVSLAPTDLFKIDLDGSAFKSLPERIQEQILITLRQHRKEHRSENIEKISKPEEFSLVQIQNTSLRNSVYRNLERLSKGQLTRKLASDSKKEYMLVKNEGFGFKFQRLEETDDLEFESYGKECDKKSDSEDDQFEFLHSEYKPKKPVVTAEPMVVKKTAISTVKAFNEPTTRPLSDKPFAAPQAHPQHSRLDLEVENIRREKTQLKNSYSENELKSDIKELLVAFGLPFVDAPSEAEAQCAYLKQAGLVDAIATQDSDVFLFGGDYVLRNLFDSKKDIELYTMNEVKDRLGLLREDLIDLAYLLGSDYTNRVHGTVSSVELLAELRVQNKKLLDDLNANLNAKNEFLNPKIHRSDLDLRFNPIKTSDLSEILREKLSFSKEKIEEFLRSVQVKPVQKKLEGFITIKNPKKIKSSRLESAHEILRKGLNASF